MTVSAEELTPELLNPAPRTLTLWSDIGCPWATLALHTLRAELTTRGEELLIDHRAFPLELFNRMPTPKGIVDAEVVIIASRIPELGWRLWYKPEHTYPSTTLPALEAVQAAKDPAVGGLRGSAELDWALREAFYVRNECISIHSVILEAAEGCEHVDSAALADALARGAGRAEVYRHWNAAQGQQVQGSPHLFAADGYAEHNPGATYHWTARPPIGLPYLVDYRVGWAGELLDRMAANTG